MRKSDINRNKDNPVVLFFILVLACVLSFASFATSMDYPISQSSMQFNDIQYFVKDKEIKKLKAGDEEFLSLLKEQTTGFAKGTAIIIPDINQSFQKQAAVSTAYDQLTHLGWNTLLLTMPSDSEPVFGAATAMPDIDPAQSPEPSSEIEGNENPPESAEVNMDGVALNLKSHHQFSYYSDQRLEDISSEIAQRVAAAFELAETYPGFYLVICQGKSCHWLNQLFRSEDIDLQTPDALIMLSAHMPDEEQNDMLAMNTALAEFPILDLYQDRDNQWVHQTIGQRRLMARKNYKTNYRQRKLNSHFDFYGQESRTVKEIYGFLTAVGM